MEKTSPRAIVVQVVAAIFGIALFFILATSLFNYVWVPYTKFYNIQLREIETSRNYIKLHCQPGQEAQRIAVGDLDKCDVAFATSKTLPVYAAWVKFMESIQLCPKGECFVMSLSLFNVAGTIAALCVIVLLASAVLYVLSWFHASYRKFTDTCLPYSNHDAKKMS